MKLHGDGTASDLIVVMQESLMLAPYQPSAAAANYSMGLAMGGGGQQLAVQLIWLLFLVGWSLAFAVPVCGVLHMLGVLHPWPGLAPPWRFEPAVSFPISSTCLS